MSYVIVQGHSMEPTFHDGDLVLAKSSAGYKRGDIIAFRVGGEFNDPAMVIHRIVGGNGSKGFVTKGDNRPRTDPWNPKTSNVVGRAVFHIPYAGSIANDIRQPWALAMLGAGVVVADGTRRRRRRRAAVRRRDSALPSYISWHPAPPEAQ